MTAGVRAVLVVVEAATPYTTKSGSEHASVKVLWNEKCGYRLLSNSSTLGTTIVRSLRVARIADTGGGRGFGDSMVLHFSLSNRFI